MGGGEKYERKDKEEEGLERELGSLRDDERDDERELENNGVERETIALHSLYIAGIDIKIYESNKF